MTQREIEYVPGLYKIFDEILVNAADNKQRDKSMNTIKVVIDVEKGEISVWNNGKGIPVVEHKEYGVFVPELIFGTLLTSSNYNDDQQKVRLCWLLLLWSHPIATLKTDRFCLGGVLVG